MPVDDDDRTPAGHFVRGIGESTRHNSLAYGYSLALTCAFGVLNLQDKTTVASVILFGLGGTLPFSIANPLVTRGFTYRAEGEPPIILSLGTSIGFLAVVPAVALTALVGWALAGWVAWFVGGFVASGGYILLGGLEFVIARVLRRLLGREHLQER